MNDTSNIKICPKCNQRVVCGGFIPNFCPWGCGSLENEPLIKEFKDYENNKSYTAKILCDCDTFKFSGHCEHIKAITGKK